MGKGETVKGEELDLSPTSQPVSCPQLLWLLARTRISIAGWPKFWGGPTNSRDDHPARQRSVHYHERQQTETTDANGQLPTQAGQRPRLKMTVQAGLIFG